MSMAWSCVLLVFTLSGEEYFEDYTAWKLWFQSWLMSCTCCDPFRKVIRLPPLFSDPMVVELIGVFSAIDPPLLFCKAWTLDRYVASSDVFLLSTARALSAYGAFSKRLG